MSNSDINLLTRKSFAFAQYGVLEIKLRTISLWGLGIFFVMGVVIGGMFLYMNSEVKKLESTKVELVREINEQSAKEGLLLALKDRILIAANALAAAKPWGIIFPTLIRISPRGGFSGLTVEATGLVNTHIEVTSVDDAAIIVTNMLALYNEHVIRSPRLVSFAMREDGGIQLALSFYPIF